MPVSIGQKAPDFTLPDTDKKPRSINEFKGKKTVLAFFPGAFTGVCTKEMCAFRDSMSRLSELDAQVVAISVDAPFSNKEFSTKYNLQFPVLSDYGRSVSNAYVGVYQDFSGLKGYTAAKRAVVVLDKEGIVKYLWVTENPGVEPPYDEVTRAIASFR